MAKLTKLQKERMSGIGGSDVAAILGLSKWQTALDVYLEKVGEKPPVIENEIMYWGKKLEPLIRKEVTKKFGYDVQQPGVLVWRMEKDRNFLIGHLDGLFRDEDGKNCLLEVKTTSDWAYKNFWSPTQIPYEYYCQVQHYMYVGEFERALVAVLVDRKMYYHWVDYHPEFAAEMVKKEIDFWNNHVIPKVPPERVTNEDVNQLLENLKDEAMVLDDGGMRLLQQYLELQEDKKGVEAQMESIKAEIANTMGDFTRGEYKGQEVCTFKQVTTNRVDSGLLSEKYPEVYNECTKQSSYRKLNVKLN